MPSSPSRRDVLGLCAVTFSLGTAGCVGDSSNENGSGEPNVSNTTTPDSTTTQPQSTISKPTTTQTETSTQTVQTAPSTRLKVWFEVNMEATLTLERLSDGEIVYEETKEYKNKETVNLTDEFDADTDYRFTIVNANGEQIFDRGIGDYEGYTLSVESGNKVEVMSHEEV